VRFRALANSLICSVCDISEEQERMITNEEDAMNQQHEIYLVDKTAE
jgi:hypothetical protein